MEEHNGLVQMCDFQSLIPVIDKRVFLEYLAQKVFQLELELFKHLFVYVKRDTLLLKNPTIFVGFDMQQDRLLQP